MLENVPGIVTEPGTPFSADNMNKIEQGIFEAHESIDIAQKSIQDLTVHANDKNNPHGVTAAQAGAEPARTLATQAEAEAGAGTTIRSWTPQRIAQAVRGAILTGLSTTANTVIAATDTVLSALGKLQAQVSARAPLNSPALTGAPTAPTPATSVNNTQIATMAAVHAVAAETKLATQTWLTAVKLRSQLPMTGLDKSVNYLCRVIADTAANNGVWQAIAGWTSTPVWAYFSDNADWVDDTELTTAITAHDNSADSHQITLADSGGSDALKNAGKDTVINWLQSFRNNIKSLLSKTIAGLKIVDNPTVAQVKTALAVTKSDVGLGNVTNDAQLRSNQRGVANGVAALGANGKVPSAQLPESGGLFTVARNNTLQGDGTSASPLGISAPVSVANGGTGAANPNAALGNLRNNITNVTTNLNNLHFGNGITRGFYFSISDGGTGTAASPIISNLPSHHAFILEVRTSRQASTTDYITYQKLYNTNGTWQRRCVSGTWSPWVNTLGADNIARIPNKTNEPVNDGTQIASEAQVYQARSYTTTARTIDTDVAGLQAVLNGLLKHLRENITIRVKPGTITGNITIERFYGPGSLIINCVDANNTAIAAANVQTHKVGRVICQNNSLGGILIILGFTATSEDNIGFTAQRNLLTTYFQYCNAVGGNIITGNVGFYMLENSGIVQITNATVSNKYYAVRSSSSRSRISSMNGTGNNVVYRSENSAWITISSVGTITGTTLYSRFGGGVIIPESNIFEGHAPLANPVFTGAPTIRATGNQGTLDNRIAVVAAASAANEVNLPIGSYIVVHIVEASNRNASAVIRLDSSNSKYNNAGSGSTVSGTWRQSGEHNSVCLFRRVA